MCKSYPKTTCFLLLTFMVIIFYYRTTLTNDSNFIDYNYFSTTTTTFNTNTTTNGTADFIPPLIHYLYLKGERGMILQNYHRLIKQCLQVNSDVKFVIWTKESMNNLMKTLATKEMRENMQEKNRRLIHRSDIFRYIVIYYFGGIYMDLDTICLQPIYPRVKENSLILTIEPPIHTKIWLQMDRVIANNFFGATPGHPFIKYLLDNLNNVKATDDVLSSTGPVYVTALYSKFFQNPNFTNISHRVLDTSEYFPEVNLHIFRDRCKSRKVPACDELDAYEFWLRTKGYKEAVIMHESSNHGWKETKGPNFNVFREFPQIKPWP